MAALQLQWPCWEWSKQAELLHCVTSKIVQSTSFKWFLLPLRLKWNAFLMSFFSSSVLFSGKLPRDVWSAARAGSGLCQGMVSHQVAWNSRVREVENGTGSSFSSLCWTLAGSCLSGRWFFLTKSTHCFAYIWCLKLSLSDIYRPQ